MQLFPKMLTFNCHLHLELPLQNFANVETLGYPLCDKANYFSRNKATRWSVVSSFNNILSQQESAGQHSVSV